MTSKIGKYCSVIFAPECIFGNLHLKRFRMQIQETTVNHIPNIISLNIVTLYYATGFYDFIQFSKDDYYGKRYKFYKVTKKHMLTVLMPTIQL